MFPIFFFISLSIYHVKSEIDVDYEIDQYNRLYKDSSSYSSTFNFPQCNQSKINFLVSDSCRISMNSSKYMYSILSMKNI